MASMYLLGYEHTLRLALKPGKFTTLIPSRYGRKEYERGAKDAMEVLKRMGVAQ